MPSTGRLRRHRRSRAARTSPARTPTPPVPVALATVQSGAAHRPRT
ncbi:hypothetical protein ACWCQZ_31560 [Streptomyces sp. NPDC002285]